MSPPPAQFEPAVMVSALALNNLKQLPYLRYRLSSTPSSTSSVATRAKWLEHGVGSHTAFHAAALAELADSIPAVLAVSIPHPSTSPSPPKPSRRPTSASTPPAPSLWLFAPSQILRRARDLLTTDFTVVDDNVWSPTSPAPVTRALTFALRRAIASAMQSENALRVGDDILHPQARFAYTFNITLGNGPDPHILIRVAARHLAVRYIDDDDTTAALIPHQPPLAVFTAPLGISGVLAPRPSAGDALSLSVLKRWREAGLLPKELKDSTVVFLKLDDGVEAPFPRACVLTVEKKKPLPVVSKPILGDVNIADITSKKPWRSNVALWRSRKRPRSPIITSSDETELSNEPPKSEPVTEHAVLHVEDNIPDNAPTAQSINNALEVVQAAGEKDPVVQLHHPLLEPIPPHTFLDAPEQDTSEGKPEPQVLDISGNSARPAFLNDKPGPSPTLSAKPTPVQSPGILGSSMKHESHLNDHVSNGLDAFFMGASDGNHQDGLGSAGIVDMADFSAFDDDVGAFFRNNMDDRYSTVENPLLQAEDTPRTPAFVQPDNFSKRDTFGNDLLGINQNGIGKSAYEGRMDVDSAAQAPSESQREKEEECSPSPSHAAVQDTINVIDSALASLRRAVPTTKPDIDTMRSQLSSLYEEDTLQRRTASLKASRTINKRRRRSFAESRQIFVTKSAAKLARSRKYDDTFSVLKDSNDKTSARHIFPNADQRFSNELRGLYVPRRPMRKYISLRRKGLRFSTPSFQEGGYQSDSTSSESEDEKPSKIIPSVVPSNIGKISSRSEQGLQSSTLPDTKISVASRTGANNKPGLCMGYDPAKIVESVAVDCSSVCMVLAAERASHGAATSCSSENSSAASGADVNGSPPINKELDAKSVLPSVPQNGARSGIASVLPKAPVPGNITGSPSSRISKKDRELLSLLSLVEMQVFGLNGFELFNSTDRSRVLVSAQNRGIDARPNNDGQSEKVSQATMRRLLLGLTRTLEMSDTFKTWIEAFRESDKSGLLPCVQGPLSINSYLGQAASVFPLSPARVCVGYDKQWMEMSGTALPLWEKEGLEPYSDSKNVEYVALAPKELEEDVKAFLKDVSTMYEECSFGQHVPIPDSITFLANSVPKSNTSSRNLNGSTLLESDKAMAEQYHFATTELYPKLTALAKEKRKNPSGIPTNIVAYIISPFEKGMDAANVALLQSVAPLVGTVPGTVPSIMGHGVVGLNLPSAPWRSSPASKSVVAITVRVIPREVVDRQLVRQTDVEALLDRPLRPQLIKAVCFAVFSSIRQKRVRTPAIDTEVGNALARGAILQDDLMSPMTPDVMGDSVGGSYGTPVSPLGVGNDDGAGYNMNMPTGNVSGHVDQSWALSPSYLHEGAIILAGVGKHIGQTYERANMVVHLGYAFCEQWSRYVFAWTDQRGELLDTATVPVSKSCLSSSRRKAFWGMWVRGQRWRLPYVEDVHATICKLGAMGTDELEDWEWVMNKMVCSSYGGSERKNADGTERRVVRRFPPLQGSKNGDDIVDVYSDVPTPATPGMGQSSNNSNGKGPLSMETKLPNINSVSILSVSEADTHLLMEKAVDSRDMDRRDFAIVSDISLSKGETMTTQANIILARFLEDGIGAMEISVLRHYGNVGDGPDMSDDRCEWDSFDVETIAMTIAINFHDLRYVASAPCWPARRWLTMLPLHLEAVQTMETNLKHIPSHANGNLNSIKVR